MSTGEKPPEKPTARIEVPPPWAVAMAEKMETGFRGVRADIHLVDNSVGAVKERLIVLETWKKESEERQTKHSGGLVRASQNDMKHDSDIAQLMTDVKAIKERDTAGKVIAAMKDAAKVPAVQRIGSALGALLLLAIAILTARAQLVLNDLEKRPVPALVDGGK